MGLSTSAFQSVEDESRSRVPPGAVVLVLAVLFIAVVILGIWLNNRSSIETDQVVTIAQLRADPDGWDSRVVTLSGWAEDVRQLPFLDQYAIYTFRDDTGTMLTLSQKGVPPSGIPEPVHVRAVFHSRITLEGELKRIAEDQLGPLGAAIVGLLVPGIPINVIYLEHQQYSLPEPG